jgi:hypothetical protein
MRTGGLPLVSPSAFESVDRALLPLIPFISPGAGCHQSRSRCSLLRGDISF